MSTKSDEARTAGMRTLPLLPLRDIIVFPHQVVPLFVGREKSVAALDEAMAHGKDIMLAAQRKARTNDPAPDDIFPFGTIGQIIQLLRLPDGTVKVLVEGKRRATIARFTAEARYFQVEAVEAVEVGAPSVELEALTRSITATFESYVKLSKRVPPEMLVSVQTIDDPGRLADQIAAQLQLKLPDKQTLLETLVPSQRLEKLFELMQAEIEIMQVERKIRTRVKKQMEKTQKEYYLNEQMQAIQKELGERDEFKNELAEIEEKLKQKQLSKEAVGRVKKELKKLRMMSPMSAEATVVRNYIDWVLSLPWEEPTQDKLEIKEAEKILEEDHYGLHKVKERILEYLAVQVLVQKIRGPILCLVGPPGVGKTSLAKSVARATGRRFVRLSLGGVRDEAEVRGHRRTYIGALPGKIIQSMKRAGSSNPVFLLDEVDKMSTDFRGDPSAALLEVLDPEQNAVFQDHYLDLDYDLSNVMFITTANSLHTIPLPLQDRMEIIQLPGYTEWEKLAIAKQYLVPKQKEQNGITRVDCEFTDDGVRGIIHEYTKEAGVRSLERELSTVCRKIAKEVVRRGKEPKGEKSEKSAKDKDGKGARKRTARPLRFRVTARSLPKYLGVPRFHQGKIEERDEVGLASGLAVTIYGGDLLPTEVTVMPGKGKLSLTGKLGDVMQESAHAAMSYVRSRAESLGLDREFYAKVDVHVHFPEGAIPKDGPSAGITMATALVSALLRTPVRRDVAMTGEITLRGRVLPIGGLKEKILAAHRGQVFTCIVPKENERDLKEIPARVMKQMTIVLVEHMDEVLRAGLVLAQPDEFLRQPSVVGDWRQPAGAAPAAGVPAGGLPAGGAPVDPAGAPAHSIVAELYVSTDVEADGPIPGPNSMLSFGSAAYQADKTLVGTFSANLIELPGAAPDPATAEWWRGQPEAWAACRRDPEEPAEVMPRYRRWLEELPGRPVFVGYPAAYDFLFVYWYLMRFAGHSPFSHAALDIKTYAMAMLGTEYRDTVKRRLPTRWLDPHPHSHVALDDAIEQGALFVNMLRENRAHYGAAAPAPQPRRTPRRPPRGPRSPR